MNNLIASIIFFVTALITTCWVFGILPFYRPAADGWIGVSIFFGIAIFFTLASFFAFRASKQKHEIVGTLLYMFGIPLATGGFSLAIVAFLFKDISF